ncbi:ATP-binding protein [Rapidithrix thailandica]|uniref:histidine kinase n=1 Tax=Rapidithrix thailandica TaxID=413964 RepID=A0AAW9RV29_9BACT
MSELETITPESKTKHKLTYSSLGHDYISIIEQLHDQVIQVSLKGKPSLTDTEHTLNLYDKMIERIRRAQGITMFYLIVDLNQFENPKANYRRLIIHKITEEIEKGVIRYTCILSPERVTKARMKILSLFNKNLKISYHHNQFNALERIEKEIAHIQSPALYTPLNTPYDKSWRKRKYIQVNGRPLRIENHPDWNIKAPDRSYELNVFLIDNNIILIKDSGHLSEEYAVQSGEIFQKVLEKAGRKLYFVADLSDLRSATRRARKAIKVIGEALYDNWIHHYYVFTGFTKTLFLIYKSIQPQKLNNATIVDSMYEGLGNCISDQEFGSRLSLELEEENYPYEQLNQYSKEALIKLIQKQQGEINFLKRNQSKRTKEIFEALSSISWDETFQPKKLKIDDPEDVFYDLFNAVTILQQDAFNIVEEQKNLNKTLEEKVLERTQEIRLKEANLSSLIENTTDRIFSVDRDFRLLVVNRAYRQYLFENYGKEVTSGHRIADIFPNKIFEYWMPFYARAFNGEIVKKLETRKVMGHDKYYELSFYPIRKENEEITGVSVFIKDISEQQAQKQRLLLQNEELKKVNSELDKFVYSASHDLRAPLSSVLGLIQISKTENQNEQINGYMDLMEKSISRLDHFIRDIIDYSRNTRLEIKKDIIQFEKLVGEIFDELHFLEESKNIDRLVEIDQQWSFVNDHRRLNVIFRNVLSNAIRYSNPFRNDSFVKVAITTRKHEVSIIIQDNGYGIPTEHLEKIFDMFYRANTHKQGSGLGLYIVKDTVNKLNGNISVSSQVNEGTTFCITLPNLSTE